LKQHDDEDVNKESNGRGLVMDILLVRNRCFMVIFPGTFENNARCAVRWERRRGCYK